ncbi:MAG: hypothetical protein NTY15_13820 [Planctomycetota bacterium]|nr:hypothetical protein [Planctomycetota bacterium]
MLTSLMATSKLGEGSKVKDMGYHKLSREGLLISDTLWSEYL